MALERLDATGKAALESGRVALWCAFNMSVNPQHVACGEELSQN
jgi:hypothetical protein